MVRARTIASGISPLTGVWDIAHTAPDRARTPSDLEALALEWIPCDGPTTAAAALRAAGRWDLDHPRDFDADDWWYRCTFAVTDPGAMARLHFEGLATVADVWLNGTHILRSENMFTASAVDVGNLVRRDNELVLQFHALSPMLSARRPRPKWRTRMVTPQQLRWFRTSVVGRAPGWCPPVAPIGPWRPISLQSAAAPYIESSDVRVELDGDDGIVHVSALIKFATESPPTQVTLAVGEHTARIAFERSASGAFAVRAAVRVPRAERWWPHTHGSQRLYALRLSIDDRGRAIDVDLGRVGFRALEFEHGADGQGFGIRVNDVPVFCRGACWTPLDLASLNSGEDDYRFALEQLRAAGVNMLRVPGTMVYEADVFHDLCDEFGILVWQDFMFANMDYPAEDEMFVRSVALEARQLLARLQARPSLAVVCGGSEIEQQAAMLGLPAERWKNAIFDTLLPDLVAEMTPGAAWQRSTPTGGAMPFHTDRGVSHYYGVGAYLRPFDDARRANVRFASECLAFANVPDATMVDTLLGEGAVPGHHPRWKAGVPRDNGSGWDFEDVRDHYVRVLFGVDPTELRARDVERYLACGRVASGEAMLRTFSEWRRPGSECRGGLVWFARDLSPGAGWGVVDVNGRPKSAYWYLKRAFAPVALVAADEGLNGLWFHALNDTNTPVDAELRLTLYRDGRAIGPRASAPVTVAPRGSSSIHADAVFGSFLDLTYAYRFGPPGHDVVAAALRDRATGAMLATACGFPIGLPATQDTALGLVASAEPIAGGYALLLKTERFAHAVAIDASGYIPDDNFFHLEPGDLKRVVLSATVPGTPLRASVLALNGTSPLTIAPMARVETADGR